MTIDKALDVTRIYSVAYQLPTDVPLFRSRPFRSPHQTITHAGLVGKRNLPHPGEISLAHRGVLFLDELLKFGMRVLEVLCQPIEDKIVVISRAQGKLTFPANFMLAQFAIRWILMFDAVTCAIPGAKRPSQEEENARAADMPLLRDETMSKVREIYKKRIQSQVH